VRERDAITIDKCLFSSVVISESGNRQFAYHPLIRKSVLIEGGVNSGSNSINSGNLLAQRCRPSRNSFVSRDNLLGRTQTIKGERHVLSLTPCGGGGGRDIESSSSADKWP